MTMILLTHQDFRAKCISHLTGRKWVRISIIWGGGQERQQRRSVALSSFINHRCASPNCEWIASPYAMDIIALSDISVGEEITISYNPVTQLGFPGGLLFDS
jgi:hypothetical protein